MGDRLNEIRGRLALANPPGGWWANVLRREFVASGWSGGVADVLSQAPADLTYLLGEVERLRWLAVTLLDQHDRSLQAMGWQPRPDHACRQCVPRGERVLDGFVCARHQAEAIRLSREVSNE